MLTYGDGVCDVDLNALIAFHEDHGKLMTVTEGASAGTFGEIEISDDFIATEFGKEAAGDWWPHFRWLFCLPAGNFRSWRIAKIWY